MKSIVVLALAVLVIAALLTAALPTLQAPEWLIFVVNADNIPVQNVLVTETRMDYSCNSTEHTFTAFTNERGEVLFKPMKFRRNLADCLSNTLRQSGALVHASFGRHVRVDVGDLPCVVDQNGFCVDWTGSPKKMYSRVVIPSQELNKR